MDRGIRFEYATCGRGNFLIRKGNVADSKYPDTRGRSLRLVKLAGLTLCGGGGSDQHIWRGLISHFGKKQILPRPYKIFQFVQGISILSCSLYVNKNLLNLKQKLVKAISVSSLAVICLLSNCSEISFKLEIQGFNGLELTNSALLILRALLHRKRMILALALEGSFGLHAKTRLLGSTFHWVYMQDRPSSFTFGAVAKTKE